MINKPGVEVVHNRDLLAEAETASQQADRHGLPIDVEQKDIGKPDVLDSSESRGHTLVDMSRDFEFFTTALIYRESQIGRDPLVDFLNHHPSSVPEEAIQVIDTTHKFFNNIGILALPQPVDMDRRLYAVRRERWIQLREFLSGIVVSDPKSKFYARVNFYEIEIVDPFALAKMSVVTTLPKVTVTVFGVSSTTHIAYIQPSIYPALPTLVRQKATQDIAVEQQLMLQRVTGNAS